MKAYEAATAELLRFTAENILTGSGESANTEKSGDNDLELDFD